ncbi:MAG: stage 0 sporulation family protein [Oscillospiraceae bacterium]|jgi:cell fate regulator YaaT (PSP1 superfamily)|nr:stage 0 sporulation family protein [Oscillospiraceae bacterium]
MLQVVGIRFRKGTKVYFFDPGQFALAIGDSVIVETVRGVELGIVASGIRELDEGQVPQPLKTIMRMASPEDLLQVEQNASSEKTAYTVCQERIAAHKLEMKLVDVEYAFDNSKVTFYFTANGRVDFRALVKNLAAIFKTRIELRQIGVRDEAKMLGGLGSCGRPICCGAFLGSFQPVSIKMAKEQNLSLNPSKISGLCGRLMCCLKYEQDHYERARKSLPKPGKEIDTPDGRAVMLDVNAVKETVKVRMLSGDGDDINEYPFAVIQRLAPNRAADASDEDALTREDIVMIEEDVPPTGADVFTPATEPEM